MHCTRSLVPIALAIAVVAAAASAQSGRTMKRLSPVVIGGTAAMAMQHPTAIAGNVYALAVCSPSFPGTLPLAIPGVIQGVLRLDPVAFGWLQFGVLDASGRTAPLSFAVPNDPLLVSASFDVQGMDLDAAGLITLTDDELETQVAAPPPPSLNMVAIAPGTFPMGSATYATSGFPWAAYESPVHAVTITQPFWMGKFEVTQAQYQALVGANPSAFPGASRPVEQVSWNQAVAFCDALTVQEAAAGRLPSGYEYRLPTEAEWEYCCRAGTTTEWHVGTSLSCGVANFWDPGIGTFCVGQTSPVGSYAANAWGLHDMHGNVWEWCLDRWDGSANYPAGAVSDPYVTSGSIRVMRGGTWNAPPLLCRSAYRHGGYPDDAFDGHYGFRVVCAPALP